MSLNADCEPECRYQEQKGPSSYQNENETLWRKNDFIVGTNYLVILRK